MMCSQERRKAMIVRLICVLLAVVLSFSGNGLANPQEKADKHIVISTGSARQGWLGVQIQDMTSKLAKKKNLSTEEGALVTKVTEKGPAEKAGLKEDDLIVEFNGHTIYDSDDLSKAVRRTKPGTTVPVTVQRNNEKKILQVTIGKMKSGPWPVGVAPTAPGIRHFGFMQSVSSYGLTMRDLNPQLAEYFGAPEGKGVLIDEVEKESDADKAGFKAGDVILRVGDESVEDVSDVREALREQKEGDKIDVEVLRKGSRKTLTLTASDEDLSDVYEFQSMARPFHLEIEPKLHENLGRELRSQLKKLENERSKDLKLHLKELQENLRSMGKQIRDEMEGLRDNLRSEC
jgi:S1-C subfamily serine protease